MGRKSKSPPRPTHPQSTRHIAPTALMCPSCKHAIYSAHTTPTSPQFALFCRSCDYLIYINPVSRRHKAKDQQLFLPEKKFHTTAEDLPPDQRPHDPTTKDTPPCTSE